MKTAVIYYSLDGNCALVAKLIKTALGADIFEIKTTDSKKRRGLAKYAWGGFQVMSGKKPDLEPLSVDISAYSLLVLGTPVWASSPTPAIVSFLSKTDIAGKKIALFCCHGGGKGKSLDKLKALLPGSSIVGEIDFANAAREKTATLEEKIGAWAKTLG